MNVNENTKNNSLDPYSEKENISHDNLIKNLFYACERCDGALVQLATCGVCKRTVLRICVRCKAVSNTGHMCMKITASSKCFEGLEIKN